MENTEQIQGQEAQAAEQDESFVDMLTGGGDTHSLPDMDEQENLGQDTSPAKADSDAGEPDGGIQPIDEADYNALRERLDRTAKRLHDTQARLHEVCTERANLRRELDTLVSDGGGDDWFSDNEEAEKKRGDLRKRLDATDADLESLDKASEQDASDHAYEQWEDLARPVRKAHPDFDALVYQYLWGKLNDKSDTYDPAVKAAWEAAPASARSPEGVYRFASDIKAKLEVLENPEEYRRRIKEEIQREGNPFGGPTGSQGLDYVNSSVSAPASGGGEDGGFVEALFR